MLHSPVTSEGGSCPFLNLNDEPEVVAESLLETKNYQTLDLRQANVAFLCMESVESFVKRPNPDAHQQIDAQRALALALADVDAGVASRARLCSPRNLNSGALQLRAEHILPVHYCDVILVMAASAAPWSLDLRTHCAHELHECDNRSAVAAETVDEHMR